MLEGFIRGIGFYGSGLTDWPLARRFLGGEASVVSGDMSVPEADMLPPNERRRSSAAVRFALRAAAEAMDTARVDPHCLATVFATSGGEYDVLHRICDSLSQTEPTVSPTLFHQSVHNAAAGYWCIANANQKNSTSIAAYDFTFALGLVEAMTMLADDSPVMLTAYDLPPSVPLYPARPLTHALAVALILDSRPAESSHAFIKARLIARTATSVPSKMQARTLEDMRIGNPCGRALPLLNALAGTLPDTVRLEFSRSQLLEIEVRACPS